MTVEEFYQSCQNCGCKTEFEVRKGKVIIQVRECVR